MNVLDDLWAATKAKAPQLLDLFGHFAKRDATGFYTVSQSGAFPERCLLTACLGLVCTVVAIVASLLIIWDQPPNFFNVGRAGAVAATTAILIAIPTFLVLRRWAIGPSFFFFANLGIVIGTLGTLLPSLILAAGFWISPGFQRDLHRLDDGQAQGTPIYAYYCGSIEDRAALYRNGQDLIRNSGLLADQNKKVAAENIRMEIETRKVRALQQASSRDPNNTELRERAMIATFNSIEGFERGLAIVDEGIPILNAELNLQRRGIDIQIKSTLAPFRLASSHPVLAGFFLIGSLSGLVIWGYAFVIVWRFIVSHHGDGRRRVRAGVATVITAAVVMLTLGLARSGSVEAWTNPPPTRAALLASIRYDFREASARCGELNNFGLW